MANKNLFRKRFAPLPPADTMNEAGGIAYRLGPKEALAQMAATGCFNNTYYTNAQDQLDALLTLCEQVPENEFIAKLALYSREKAFLKDMPVALLLILSRRDASLFHRVFERIVDNGQVLRSFIQMLRSGQFGRKSLSYSLQKEVQRWFNRGKVHRLITATIGNDPTLRDILRIARPTPCDNAHRALFGWIAECPVEKWKPAALSDLPKEVEELENFRKASSEKEQLSILEKFHYRWDLLADSAKGPEVWKKMAHQMGTQALRMNLNTLMRHGVLDDPEMVSSLAEKISDARGIRSARQFPYQYFAAYLNASPKIPQEIKQALIQGAEIACGNIPKLPGPVVIGLDVSGSMQSPVTGRRTRTPGKMRCVDVAALFAAALYRNNPDSLILPFDTKIHKVKIDSEDTILSLAERLSRYGGGGTDCSLPLAEMNQKRKKNEFIGCILVSDNESWVSSGRSRCTDTLEEWDKFLSSRQEFERPMCKLVCIDIQPHSTTQAPNRPDILNVGGFNDTVFQIVDSFFENEPDRFVKEVEAVVI